MKKLISIIIPVYNTERYLEMCLDSVCKQSLQNIEIIVVNDGSVDNSELLIESYMKKDSRIILINQSNMGLSEARNTGIRFATGDYVAFVDSDDWIETNMYSAMLNLAYKNEADIVVCNSIKFRNESRKEKKPTITARMISQSDIVDKGFLFEYVLGHGYGISACNKIYKREFLIKNSIVFIKNDEIFAEDMLFNLLCLLNFPLLAITDKYYYNYRTRNDSITQSNKPNLGWRLNNLVNYLSVYIEERNLSKAFETLMTLMVINSINVCMYNAYAYSKKPKQDMCNELDLLIRNKIIHTNLVNMARGKHIFYKGHIKWGLLTWCISLLGALGMKKCLCAFQLIRFRLITSKK